MKKILIGAAVVAVLLIGSAFTIQSVINWKINSEKAMVKFTIQAHKQELVGNFKAASGEVKFDEKNLSASSITCSVDVATINTGIEGRDKHLQAKGFFDAANNPAISYTSNKIENTADGYIATGNLTVKGITKEVKIPFTIDGSAPESPVFKGTFGIKRSDFGVGTTDGDIADEVNIILEIPVIKG